MATMIYLVEGTDQKVILCESVVRHVRLHRQTRVADPESGGQLFAKVTATEILITRATGPYKEDRVSRYRLTLNRWRQKADIRKLFRAGLHFVGEWHTHPEPFPSPSSIDLENIQECFVKSRHELSSFLMLIVGTDESEQGLWFSQHNESQFRQLRFMGAEESGCNCALGKGSRSTRK